MEHNIYSFPVFTKLHYRESTESPVATCLLTAEPDTVLSTRSGNTDDPSPRLLPGKRNNSSLNLFGFYRSAVSSSPIIPPDWTTAHTLFRSEKPIVKFSAGGRTPNFTFTCRLQSITGQITS